MKWISVKDQLPENEVTITHPGLGITVTAETKEKAVEEIERIINQYFFDQMKKAALDNQ